MANVATELYKYYTSVGEDQKSGDQKRTNKRKRISPVLPIADSGPKEKESDAKRIPAGALVEILTNPTSVNPVGVGLRFAKRRKVKTKNSDNDSKEKKDKEKNKERKQREEQKEKEKEVHVVDEGTSKFSLSNRLKYFVFMFIYQINCPSWKKNNVWMDRQFGGSITIWRC